MAIYSVAYSSSNTSRTRTFKNIVNIIREFIQTIFVVESHCVLEATDNYSALLVYLLSEPGVTVSLENPLKTKNFVPVMLTIIKTDEVDACLAFYGEKMKPVLYKLRSEPILVL